MMIPILNSILLILAYSSTVAAHKQFAVPSSGRAFLQQESSIVVVRGGGYDDDRFDDPYYQQNPHGSNNDDYYYDERDDDYPPSGRRRSRGVSVTQLIKNGNRKIGLPMLGVGGALTVFGMTLFFNKTLMRLGNLCFVAGIPLTLGPTRTLGYLMKKDKARATACLALGILLVFSGWPVIGIALEAFGLLNLFGNMFPIAMAVLKNMPVIGPLLKGGDRNKKNRSRRNDYDRDPYHDDRYNDRYDDRYDNRGYDDRNSYYPHDRDDDNRGYY